MTEFDDGDGRFMDQPDVPEITEIDTESVTVEPTERWDRHGVDAVAEATEGVVFLHGYDDALVATTKDAAECLAVQTTMPAEISQPFWTSFSSTAFETFAENHEDLWPPLVFDSDEMELEFRAAANVHEIPLWSSEYHEWPEITVPVESRDEYTTTVVPGWRLAGGFTMATRQCQANRGHSVSIHSDGDTLTVAADAVDDPHEIELATGDFPEFQSIYSETFLGVLANAIGGDYHQVRIEEEKPILIDNGTTRYALAPRLPHNPHDGQDGDGS